MYVEFELFIFVYVINRLSTLVCISLFASISYFVIIIIFRFIFQKKKKKKTFLYWITTAFWLSVQ